MSKNQLAQLYTQGNEFNWSSPPELRRDWSIARGWINTLHPSTAQVLDVGCSNGGFLDFLGADYQKYGIEIHPMAKKHLDYRGINFLGTNIESLNDARLTFDCITAFDIIEHISTPKKFISQCIEALSPRGHILISSGNMDASTFRLMGSHYWYCTIAEHISFINPAWCHKVEKEMGLQVTHFKTFAHGSTCLKSRIKELLKNTFYKFMPNLFSHLRKNGCGKKNAKKYPEIANHPPFWGSANDHFMVLIKKTHLSYEAKDTKVSSCNYSRRQFK